MNEWINEQSYKQTNKEPKTMFLTMIKLYLSWLHEVLLLEGQR